MKVPSFIICLMLSLVSSMISDTFMRHDASSFLFTTDGRSIRKAISHFNSNVNEDIRIGIGTDHLSAMNSMIDYHVKNNIRNQFTSFIQNAFNLPELMSQEDSNCLGANPGVSKNGEKVVEPSSQSLSVPTIERNKITIPKTPIAVVTNMLTRDANNFNDIFTRSINVGDPNLVYKALECLCDESFMNVNDSKKIVKELLNHFFMRMKESKVNLIDCKKSIRIAALYCICNLLQQKRITNLLQKYGSVLLVSLMADVIRALAIADLSRSLDEIFYSIQIDFF